MRLIRLHTPGGGPVFYLNPLEIYGVGPTSSGETIVRTAHRMDTEDGRKITALYVEETPEEVAGMFEEAMGSGRTVPPAQDMDKGTQEA